MDASKALAVCKRLRVLVAPKKIEGPSTKLTFLGIEIDLVVETLPPKEKLHYLHQQDNTGTVHAEPLPPPLAHFWIIAEHPPEVENVAADSPSRNNHTHFFEHPEEAN